VSGIRALVFDLDGTLVNTLADVAESMNHVLAKHGLPGYEHSAYRRFIGEGIARLVSQALPPRAIDATDAIERDYRAYYAEHMLDQSKPYPGVEELLAELTARGVPFSVLSNKPDAATQHMIRTLFAHAPFVDVVGQKPEKPNKPDPTVALELAQAMRVAPSRCAFVGDSGIDMATGRAAGMHTVGVTWGFRDRAELRAHRADSLIERPDQLIALLG
jgi:phosphoglycolate phosphatase